MENMENICKTIRKSYNFHQNAGIPGISEVSDQWTERTSVLFVGIAWHPGKGPSAAPTVPCHVTPRHVGQWETMGDIMGHPWYFHNHPKNHPKPHGDYMELKTAMAPWLGGGKEERTIKDNLRPAGPSKPSNIEMPSKFDWNLADLDQLDVNSEVSLPSSLLLPTPGCACHCAHNKQHTHSGDEGSQASHHAP